MLFEDDPRDIVLGWVIDDGVKTRGNRDLLFSPKFKFASVGCVAHEKFRVVTFVNFYGYRWPDQPCAAERGLPAEPAGRRAVVGGAKGRLDNTVEVEKEIQIHRIYNKENTNIFYKYKLEVPSEGGDSSPRRKVYLRDYQDTNVLF